VIKIGKTQVPAEVDGRNTVVELFTMSIGEDAIYLVPLKTWSQMDIFKWRVQGKLPGTPAGLEVTFDHVKVAGETVSTRDPQGCARLEHAFNTWLALEREALEQAAQKAQTHPAQEPAGPPEEQALHYKVEGDKAGQPHIICLEGRETVANVAVTVPGINSLITQGLLRKPHTWKIGALRDWLELDGQVFKLKDGDAAVGDLEHVLNERYAPDLAPAEQRDVSVFANPASSSGFDIQFPVADNLLENKRRHLDAEAMELLSDPQRCRVLRRGVLVRLAPPNLIFKLKTADGGERHLEPGPQSTVTVLGEVGQTKAIPLSEPVNHLGLGVAELTEIFNHPAVNRLARRRIIPVA
jgi:hypothetical protein